MQSQALLLIFSLIPSVGSGTDAGILSIAWPPDGSTVSPWASTAALASPDPWALKVRLHIAQSSGLSWEQPGLSLRIEAGSETYTLSGSSLLQTSLGQDLTVGLTDLDYGTLAVEATLSLEGRILDLTWALYDVIPRMLLDSIWAQFEVIPPEQEANRGANRSSTIDEPASSEASSEAPACVWASAQAWGGLNGAWDEPEHNGAYRLSTMGLPKDRPFRVLLVDGFAGRGDLASAPSSHRAQWLALATAFPKEHFEFTILLVQGAGNARGSPQKTGDARFVDALEAARVPYYREAGPGSPAGFDSSAAGLGLEGFLDSALGALSGVTFPSGFLC